MRKDHRGGYVPVPQQLLHRPDIVPRLQQMGREGVPQGMRAGPFADLDGEMGEKGEDVTLAEAGGRCEP